MCNPVYSRHVLDLLYTFVSKRDTYPYLLILIMDRIFPVVSHIPVKRNRVRKKFTLECATCGNQYVIPYLDISSSFIFICRRSVSSTYTIATRCCFTDEIGVIKYAPYLFFLYAQDCHTNYEPPCRSCFIALAKSLI